jgi:GT2 family glycosyltransferase
MTQLCGHPWRGLPPAGQQDVDRLCRNSLRAAVTGALMCLSRARFEAVGGFDEAAFPVTLNDVDLCLKLHAHGWFTAYAAQAEAYHHEGESRGADIDPEKQARRQRELNAFAAKWSRMIEGDPWLPACVSRATERFDFR